MNTNSPGPENGLIATNDSAVSNNPALDAHRDRHDGDRSIAATSAAGTSPVRRLFESALREGPLFQPEGVVADKVSETDGETAAQKYLDKAKGTADSTEPLNQTVGWIFVAASASQNVHLRIAVSERHRTENAADFRIEQLSENLGLEDDEILRYAAFSHDAYRALAAARKALKVFETQDLRYHCPSAVAATAIESLRETISSRKTNFEATSASTTHDPSIDHLGMGKAALPQLLLADEQRAERHAAISNLMLETEKSLSDASQLLDGIKTSKRRPTTRRQLPGMIWRRRRREGVQNSGRNQTNAKPKRTDPKLASRGVLTAPVVQTMEQAIMRREASQYLNQRRVEMQRIVALTFTTVSAASVILMTAVGAWPVWLAIGCALGLGAVASLMAHLMVKKRYARPTTVWKEILDRPVPAPR